MTAKISENKKWLADKIKKNISVENKAMCQYFFITTVYQVEKLFCEKGFLVQVKFRNV